MSDRLKLYIFTDAKSNQVLLTRKAGQFDFWMDVKGVHTHLLSSALPLPEVKNLNNTFTPDKGFQKSVAKPNANEKKRLETLKRKIDVMILVSMSLQVMQQDIELSFSYRALSAAPVTKSNFKNYWRLMAQEKRQLIGRIHRFKSEFLAKINAAESAEQVDALYEYIRFNVNLGVYSAMNRERRGIGVIKSKSRTN